LKALLGQDVPPLVAVARPVADINAIRGASVEAKNVALAARGDKSGSRTIS
jgi:purine catabolism regulator